VPAIVAGTLRLLWEAGRRDPTVSAVAQLVSGLGIVLQLLVARNVLGAVLDADPPDASPPIGPGTTSSGRPPSPPAG
jgi:hypothetical protein